MQSAEATATYWVIKAFNMSIFPVCKIMSGMLIESLRNYKKYLINMSSWKKAQGKIESQSLWYHKISLGYGFSVFQFREWGFDMDKQTSLKNSFLTWDWSASVGCLLCLFSFPYVYFLSFSEWVKLSLNPTAMFTCCSYRLWGNMQTLLKFKQRQ